MSDDAVLRRFSALVDLTPGEVSALRGLSGPPVSFVPGEGIQ